MAVAKKKAVDDYDLAFNKSALIVGLSLTGVAVLCMCICWCGIVA